MLDRIRFRVALGLCLLFLSACGGGGGGGGGAISRIEITPDQGNLAVGTTLSLSAVAKTSSGNKVDNVSFAWQSLDPSIASIDAEGVVTGNGIGVTTIIAATGTFSGSATVGVVSPNPGQSNLTFSGTVLYEDKPYALTGFTGALVPTPVRGTIINVIAIDGFATIATGATGSDGTFTFNNVDNAARRGGVYLQVVSKTEPNNPSQVEIRNNASDQALLSLISSPFDDSSGTDFAGLSVTATAASGVGGLFNIIDVFSTASELIRNDGGLCTPPAAVSCTPPLLVAYWEPGSAEGTFYDDQLDAIFILGGGDAQGDTDEYDDSVIAHEYGHFAVHHFSKDDSLGGEHFITDNDQDIRLSWSEGWGNFFSSAVRDNPVYVDTATNGPTFSFNLEDYSSPQSLTLKTLALYTTSEIAVAGVLWDVFDPAGSLISESHDQLSLGFGPIWQTVLRIEGTTPATMESFWLQFQSVDPSSTAGLQSIMEEREMALSADASETNGQTTEATALTENTAQQHTFYQNSPAPPTDDEDVISFHVTAGTRYTLETLNLTNGADTLLFITDTSNNSLNLQNDNRNGNNYQNCGANPFTGNSSCPANDKTTLSSSITWTASDTTDLHAHVQRSPNAPPSAGLFGSYDIRLKRP